jgi:hypothetical protein
LARCFLHFFSILSAASLFSSSSSSRVFAFLSFYFFSVCSSLPHLFLFWFHLLLSSFFFFFSEHKESESPVAWWKIDGRARRCWARRRQGRMHAGAEERRLGWHRRLGTTLESTGQRSGVVQRRSILAARVAATGYGDLVVHGE